MPTKSPIPQSSPFEQTPSAQNVNEFTSPPFYEFQQTPLAQTVDDQYFDQMLEVLPNNEYQSGKNTSGEDSGLLRPVLYDVQQMNPQLPEEQPHQEQQNNAEEEAPNYYGGIRQPSIIRAQALTRQPHLAERWRPSSFRFRRFRLVARDTCGGHWDG